MAEPRIQKLLEQLTLEEKVSLLAGADVWHTQEIPEHGIGSIKTTDGPSGARGKLSVDGTKAAFVPGPVCQAATWSKQQMRELGRLLCREAKTKSAHVLLAPTICCARNPLGGRNFECFGEDPFLAGSLAVEYVAGVQEDGKVAATPKHFVANEQEHERFSIDAQIPERALREIYLRPFEMVIRAPCPPECLMTAYNSINGKHADMNSRLIDDILRKQWGFQGLVMSDWGGTNSTLESLLAGTDLEMPGPPEKRGQKLLETVSANTSDVQKALAAIDTSSARVLRLAEKHGLLGLTPEAARSTRDSPEVSSTTAQDVRLMRSIAANGIVLLKNDAKALPLCASELNGKQVAFIGPNALVGTPGGGGSASMNPQYLSQPMQSFQMAASELGCTVSVKHAIGAVAHKWLPLLSKPQWSTSGLDTAQPGDSLIRIDFYKSRDPEGAVEETQYRDSSSIDLCDSAPKAFQVDPVPPYSFWVTSVLTPQSSGTHSFSVSSVGDATLRVDGQLVIDNRNWTQPGETFYSFGSAEVTGKKYLEAGKPYVVCVEGCVRREPRPNQAFSADVNHVFAAHPSVRLGYEEELPGRVALIQEAITLADESEAAVVVLGLTDEWESEGYDRQSMALPGGQDDLANALLSKVQRPERLIFVNQSGSPVELPWIDRASTFVQAWYGGQEAGNALSDILLGTVNPSGKLPITWPKAYSDLPFAHDPESWPGVNGTVTYKEDYKVGYRWYSHHAQSRPQWWFGYGQSYTSFEQKIVSVGCADTGYWTLEVLVVNTGNRDGAEVVQLYWWPAGNKQEAILVGFDKTPVIRPQESLRLTLKVNKRDAARWVEDKWAIAPGEYMIGLGIEAEEKDGKAWKLYENKTEWSAAGDLH